MNISVHDKSNGYEDVAESFMAARNPRIGASTVRKWSHTLAPGCKILDVGCGHGEPISQVLSEEGFALYGVDASAKMVASFRNRFPNAQAECSAAEDSEFFARTFGGVVAWGLLFLLPPNAQRVLIRKVAKALDAGGKFLFTSPNEAVAWQDALTGRESVSLGSERYRQFANAEGLVLIGEMSDEGNNHYYSMQKP